MTQQRLSRARSRAVDRAAAELCGLPTLVLMEHAGRSAAELVARLVAERRPGARVRIFCGGGNNGGDGFVAARFLDAAGIAVECVCLASLEATCGDARLEREIAARSGLTLRDGTTLEGLEALQAAALAGHGPLVLVDALLGTGFTPPLKPHVAAAIAQLNELRTRRDALTVSLDLPSGLACDDGTPSDPTVKADVTATFVAEKLGFAAAAAQRVLGQIVVLGIGAPRAALEATTGRQDVNVPSRGA